MFKSSYYADLSLNQWMALTPPELLKVHLNLDQQVTNALSKARSRSAGIADVNPTGLRQGRDGVRHEIIRAVTPCRLKRKADHANPERPRPWAGRARDVPG